MKFKNWVLLHYLFTNIFSQTQFADHQQSTEFVQQYPPLASLFLAISLPITSFHFFQRSESVKSTTLSVKHKILLPHGVFVISLYHNLKFIFNDSGHHKNEEISGARALSSPKQFCHTWQGSTYSSELSGGNKKNILCCFLKHRFPMLWAMTLI